MKQQNYFDKESENKGLGFKIILALVAFMTLVFTAFSLKRIITNPVQVDPTIPIEPLWYSVTLVGLSIFTLTGLLFTYKYKKWGVYMVVASLFLMIVANPTFSLIKTILPMFTLFTFVGYGLFEIIPRWKYFT